MAVEYYNGKEWIIIGDSSGGTTDYEALSSKPQINNVTLSGNKTASDLGLAVTSHSHVKNDISDFPNNVSAFTNDAGYLTEHQDISGKVNEPTEDGTAGQVLATDGNGGRMWITVGGGGTGEIVAAFTVSNAGANAIITATSSDHTYTGGADADGNGIVNILHTGTYVFASTVKGQTKTVTVYSDGNYNLDFSLVLYEAGEQFSTITGGWTARNYSISGSSSAGNFDLENARIAVRGSSSTTQRSYGGGTVNGVDISGYTRMCVTYSSSIGSSNDNRLHLVIMPVGETDTANALRDSGELGLSSAATTVKTAITPVSTLCNVAVIAHRKSNTATYFYITKVWLE